MDMEGNSFGVMAVGFALDVGRQTTFSPMHDFFAAGRTRRIDAAFQLFWL